MGVVDQHRQWFIIQFCFQQGVNQIYAWGFVNLQIIEERKWIKDMGDDADDGGLGAN